MLARRGLSSRLFRRCGAQPTQHRFCSGSGMSPEEEAEARAALGKRAHREVQIARRRRREADDEHVLYSCASAAGFTACDADGSEEVQRRRKVIDRFLTARAEEVMDAVVAGKPLDEVTGFTLEVAPSRDLPQPIAGDGVFLKDAPNGEVPAGTLMAFYPGTVYMPHEVRWLGGDGPLFKRAGQHTQSHVIARVGGVMIDGLWSNLEIPSAEFDVSDERLTEIVAGRIEQEDVTSEVGLQAVRDDMEAFRAGLCEERRSPTALVPAPDHRADTRRLRTQNAMAVGEMVNHPPDGRPANVLGWPVDLNLFGATPEERAAYASASPNTYGLRPAGAPAPGAPCPYTVVMVAAHTIKVGEELYLDYGMELLELEDIPVWFAPASLRGDAEETDPKKAPAIAIREELHAWREAFERTHGRKPTRNDLLTDPTSVSLFETFQKYRKLGDL